MKIAINCWILKNKNLDGIGYFIINTFPKIIASHPEVEFLILCDKNFNETYFDFPNVELCRIFPPYRHPVLYIYYMEFVVSAFLKKNKVDLMIAPDSFLSLSTKVKQLAFMHDINFVHYPQYMDLKNRLYYNFFFPRFARKAKRLVTISDFSKKDIVESYHITPRKIDVVYLASSDEFQPIAEFKKTELRNKYCSGKPFFFFVGSLHPRKNIKRLIVAFDIFKTKTRAETMLVLAGAILWKTSDIEEVYTQSKYKDDIIFAGRINDEELKGLTASAFASTFVTIFEGFGMPVAEAMRSGTPVITSNASSMPEVGGEAVLYADPFDVQSIAGQMEVMYENETLRNDLIQKGFEQVKKFSWEKAANETWESVLTTFS